jgi:hypothetical protein
MKIPVIGNVTAYWKLIKKFSLEIMMVVLSANIVVSGKVFFLGGGGGGRIMAVIRWLLQSFSIRIWTSLHVFFVLCKT